LAIAEIDGEAAPKHPLGVQLREAGFLPSKQGFYLPRNVREQVVPLVAADAEVEPSDLGDEEPEAQDA
jgi:hypothetical protein